MHLASSFVTPELYIRALNAAAGWDFKTADWDTIAERLLIMARLYNIREGMRPERDDVLPWRVTSNRSPGDRRPAAFIRMSNFSKIGQNGISSAGRGEDGIPLPQHLEQLGLDFAIDTIKDVLT